jgi:hypothetical protein
MLSSLHEGFNRSCHVNVAHSVATNARFAIRIALLMRFFDALMQIAPPSSAQRTLQPFDYKTVARFIRFTVNPYAHLRVLTITIQ